jgi:diguanylate cyclase (GGDEF)-like protein
MRFNSLTVSADKQSVEDMHRGRAIHVRTYLISLVLVPLIGFTALAVRAVVPRLKAQKDAQIAQQRIRRTAVMVRFSILVANEQFPIQLRAGQKTFKFDDSLAKSFLGFSPSERMVQSANDTIAFVSQNQSDPAVVNIGQKLAMIRKGNASGALTELQLFDQFRDVQAKVFKEWKHETDSMSQLELGDAGALRQQIDLLEATVQFSEYNRKESEGMFKTLYSPVGEQLQLQLDLNRNRGYRESALGRVLDLAPKNRKQMVVDLRDGPNAKQIEATLLPFLGGKSFDPNGAQLKIAMVIRGAVGFNTQQDKFLEIIIGDSVQKAKEIEGRAGNDLESTIATFLFVGLLSIGFAALVSRMFTRPLLTLANRAKRVASGDLDVEPHTGGGPFEVSTVSRVVDDLVASLKKVQLQTAALASGALSDEVLADMAPGPLGESVQGSVNRLLRSIREREDLQEALSHQATHDALTGLPNRPAALIALDQALARAARHDQSLAVLFIDLDEFKRANDEGGHAVGDHVLQIVGHRIRSVARNGDVVARLGGDEFLVIAEMIGTSERAEVLASRIIEALSEPMDIDGAIVRIGASVGFAMPDERVADAGDLLRKSDLAMYAAKQSGRGRVVEFDINLNKAYEEKRLVEKAMIEALQLSNGLSLHYQPVVDVRTGQLLSVEALLRWNTEMWGAMSPASFIPLLEQSPVICDVGRWVLVKASTEIQKARQIPDFEDLSVAVNISARHLENVSLLSDVKHALDVSGLPAHALTIELTETALVDLGKATQQTRALQALGVKIAIDDFGTGYTSVAQLTRMPVNVLKIDRAFIDQIGVPSSRRIVELVIEIGQTLGMQVVGEGVEQQSQLDALGELGCDSAQGYLLSKPMPIEALFDLLNSLPVIDALPELVVLV